MKHTMIQSTIPSPVDGLEISMMSMIPEGGYVRCVFQLVHGMCEYKERYIPFMEYLADEGYASVIHDHRGHGQSVRSRGDLGYMYGVGADGLLRDMESINSEIHRSFPGVPLILLGHSMGSLAVRAYTALSDEGIDALIVCGNVADNPVLPIGRTLAQIEGRLRGMDHRSRLLTALSFSGYSSRFRKTDKTTNAWLCSDPEVVKEYNKSEYCGFMFSDEAFLTLFDLISRTYDTARYTCGKPELPVLFISGADDPCTVNKKGFEKSLQSMRSAGYRQVSGRLYPGMRHEILNEIGKEQVYADVEAFARKIR